MKIFSDRYIKFHLENVYSSEVPESSCASGLIFNYLVSSYKIAEFLMPFQITSVSIKLPFNVVQSHLSSRKQLISVPTTIIVNESKLNFKKFRHANQAFKSYLGRRKCSKSTSEEWSTKKFCWRAKHPRFSRKMNFQSKARHRVHHGAKEAQTKVIQLLQWIRQAKDQRREGKRQLYWKVRCDLHFNPTRCRGQTLLCWTVYWSCKF